MIKYIIPSIGHGCCVEQLAYFNCERHRILYDCGSNNINLIHEYIDKIDTSIPTTLVISHLHRDHINGIPYLLSHFENNGQRIKQLFLPSYYPEIIKLFLISVIGTMSDEVTKEDKELINFIADISNPERYKKHDSEKIKMLLDKLDIEYIIK